MPSVHALLRVQGRAFLSHVCSCFYASLMMYEFFELSILLLFSLFLSYIDPSCHRGNDASCKQLVHSFRDTELTI